jgi:hypothetical protein
MAQMRMERLEAPTLGMDTDSGPDSVPKGKALTVYGFLPGYPGKVRMRAGIGAGTSFAIGPGNGTKFAGIWHHGNIIIMSTRDDSLTRTVNPTQAWYRRSTAANLSRADASNMYVYDADAGSQAAIVPTRATSLGYRFTRQGRYLYGHAFDTATDAGTDIYAADGAAAWIIRRTQLLRYDTQGAAVVPTGYGDNAPRGSQDIRVHYNRLFLAGGPSGFSTPVTSVGTGVFNVDIDPNSLWFSQDLTGAAVNANGDLKAEVARWAHPITFAANRITVDSADPSDFIVGLAKVGRNLAIFKRHSIHVLYGYGPSTFAVREFAKGTGCMDQRTIVEVDNGCYFLSKEGYMYFDGSQLINVSAGVKQDIVRVTEKYFGDQASLSQFPRASAVRISNDYILLSVASEAIIPPTTNAMEYLFHIPTRSWVVPAWSTLGNVWYVKLDTRTMAADYQKIRDITGFTAPNTTSSKLDGVGLPGFNWTSRVISLATPGYKAQLHRVMIDYQLPHASGSDGQAAATVNLLNTDNTTLATWTLPSKSGGQRARHRQDVNIEVSDVMLQIIGPGVTVTNAEILNAWIEYSPSAEFH